jgi:hypothetical protein
VAKITLAELRKRAPNLPIADLRRNLRIIRQMEKRLREVDSQTQTPKARRAAKLAWKRHVDSCLAHIKKSYDEGNETAFWDAVLFCEQTGSPKPTWVSEELDKYARDRINRVPLKNKAGRPADLSQHAHIYGSVDWWRKQRRGFGRQSKPRNFSFTEAFKKVQAELAKEGVNLQLPSLRAAYDRAKKRSYLSPFLD